MPRDHVPPELFEEEVYDRFYGEALEEVAPENARLIERVADLRAGERVLDAPCGNGRVSVQLAELGCDVVGVDRSERFIALARARPAPGQGCVRFEVADLSALAYDGEFDAVVCWYTSFGYFDRDTNRAVLRAFRAALRPGGRLVLEQRNPDLMRRAVEAGRGATAYLIDKGDDLLFDRITFDGERSHTSASWSAGARSTGGRSRWRSSTARHWSGRCGTRASTASACSTRRATRSRRRVSG